MISVRSRKSLSIKLNQTTKYHSYLKKRTMESKLRKLKIIFGDRKAVLKEKNTPSPFHIDFLINNTRLSRVVLILNILVFIFKAIAVLLVITSMVWGFYFFLTSYSF